MSSDSTDNAKLSEALSTLNIESNEPNNEEKGTTTNVDADRNSVVICANCGKEGEGDSMNTCNKCDLVKYCNVVCKKKHKSKHKKKCERRAAELHEEALFKQPSPKEDCPICFLRLPAMESGSKYWSCCGMTYCSGCCHAPMYDNLGNMISEKKCPFCRVKIHDSHSILPNKVIIELFTKRVEKDDTMAIYNLGHHYNRGRFGLLQDSNKAMELWHRAGKLGNSNANATLGNKYYHGEGVQRDIKKATYHWKLAAIGGDIFARYNLGYNEAQAGNWDRALKHFMIAAEDGCNGSLKCIQRLTMAGHATKEDYANALRLYQEYLDEIKSPQRDEAAAFMNEEYKYY